MRNTPIARDHAADRAAIRNAFLIIACVLLAGLVVDSLSIATENARDGGANHPAEPWILETSSRAVILLLVPGVILALRTWPATASRWPVWVPAHIAASIVFSAIHVSAMVGLRKVLFPLFLGHPYAFTSDLVRSFIYEYRKDAFAYAIIVFVIVASRHWEEQRLAVSAAREDARATRRLTLRCGGRTMWVDADEVSWAKAASNYVEINAGERTLLARATLAEIERQLVEAGVRATRVHRSYVANADHVAETAPTGEGDVRITMRDGSVIPGSRRYRGRLEGG